MQLKFKIYESEITSALDFENDADFYNNSLCDLIYQMSRKEDMSLEIENGDNHFMTISSKNKTDNFVVAEHVKKFDNDLLKWSKKYEKTEDFFKEANNLFVSLLRWYHNYTRPVITVADIAKVFKEETKFTNPKIYPLIRYAFISDIPDGDTTFFRTRYFGDWKDLIQVRIKTVGNVDFYIYRGEDKPIKTSDFNILRNMLKELHQKKVEEYGYEYLTNEYSTDYSKF